MLGITTNLEFYQKMADAEMFTQLLTDLATMGTRELESIICFKCEECAYCEYRGKAHLCPKKEDENYNIVADWLSQPLY